MTNPKMIVKVAPEKATMIERYRYAHRVDSHQRADAIDGTGAVVLEFVYDAAKHASLADLRRHCEAEWRRPDVRANTSKKPLDAIRVGMLKVPNSSRCRPVEVPVNALTTKLVRCDVVKVEHPFPVQALRSIPLRVEAKVLDEQLPMEEDFFESHEFNDQLRLQLRVSVEIPESAMRCSVGVARAVKQVLKGQKKVEFRTVQSGNQAPLEDIGEKLCALCNRGGGLMICGAKNDGTIEGVSEALAEILARTTETAALASEPPIAIDEPIKVDIDGRLVLVVQVRSKLKASDATSGYVWRESTKLAAAYDSQIVTPYHEGRLSGEGRLSDEECTLCIRRGATKQVAFVPTISAEIAEMQAAMANAGGGIIFYGVRSGGPGRPGEVMEEFTSSMLDDIKKHSHQRVLLVEPLLAKVGARRILYQHVAGNSRDAYRTSGGFPTYDGRSIRLLTQRQALELLRARQPSGGSMLPQPEPVIRRCTLEWLEFPEESAAYNPETGRLEWINERLIPSLSQIGSYHCDLTASISRSKELLARDGLKGELVVAVNGVLLGNSNCQYFNAEGLRDDANMDAVTELHSDLSVSLVDVLGRRPYYPSRSLSVYGVEPRPERVKDILRVLNNAGLMIQDVEPMHWGPSSLEAGIRLRGEKQGRRGVTHIDCHVKGTVNAVRRTLKRGDRTDDKRLKSGAMHFRFVADTEEENHEIVSLLNEIVEGVHQRLRYLRVE